MYQVWRNKKESINRIIFCQLRFLKPAFLLGGLILLIALIGAGSSSCFSQSRFSVKDVHHIILVSIDTCRADYLSCCGYPLRTTPNIDRFAQENILFTNAVTPVPVTLPTHCSMLTGAISPYYGLHYNIGCELGQARVTWLAISEISSNFIRKARHTIFQFQLRKCKNRD